MQFNPAVTVAISWLQEREADTPLAFFSMYFAVCFFGPLLGGLIAGLAIPSLSNEENDVGFSVIMKKINNNASPSMTFHKFTKEYDEEESTPMLLDDSTECTQQSQIAISSF